MRDVIWTRSGSKTDCRPLCLHLLPTDLPVSQQSGNPDDVHDDGGDGGDGGGGDDGDDGEDGDGGGGDDGDDGEDDGRGGLKRR